MTRVLVVEDSATQAQELAFLLESEGFVVDWARDGLEGIERCRSESYDAVLSDVVMPNVDGYELCRRLKADAATRGVPVILLTSLAEPMDIISGLESGADNFITKPYDAANLVGRVRQLLDTRELRRERRMSVGVELSLMGRRFTINSEKEQMLDLLISTFEEVLRSRQREWEAKLAEESIRASQRFLQSALDALSSRIAILDHHHRILAVNAPWHRLTSDVGLTFENGGVGAEYLDVWRAVFAGDEETERALAAGIADVESGKREVFTLELSARLGGHPRWVALSATRFEGRDPSLIAVEHEDITERKEAQERLALHAEELARSERALRDQTRILRSVLDSMGDGVIVADQEGTILLVNPAAERLVGARTGDRVGASPASQRVHLPEGGGPFPPDRLPLTRAIHGESTDGVELLVDPGGPREATVSATGRPMRDEHGAPRGGVVVYHDVSTRKAAERALQHTEEQLRQAQKMEAIGQLAGGVAHDFNNLLAVIGSYSELLHEELSPDDPKRADVEAIREASQRAAALTRQLLAFSRRQVLQPVVLDLNQVVSEVDKMLGRVIGEDIRLVTVLAARPARVKADPGQVHQIVLNLAVNARDAMPKGGKLTIETSNVVLDDAFVSARPGVSSGPHVMLAVSDTGVGMDRATQARIFEPFFTTKGVGKGTGLGLSTVFGIVRQSGGHIYVYSEPGRGTIFKVYLPSVDEPLSARERSVSPAQRSPAGGTVLLVEDEEAVRNVAKRILRNAGWTVLEAGHADEARRMASAHAGAIDVVLTDLVMPGTSGPDLAQELTRARPALKVLFMSGYSGATVLDHAGLVAGASFLEKPFTPESLARKLREMLEQQPSEEAAQG